MIWAFAQGLTHEDKTPYGQSTHKADHADEDVEADCHELFVVVGVDGCVMVPTDWAIATNL